MTDNIDAYRDQLAAEHHIPDEYRDLLSAADPGTLKAQAEKLAAILDDDRVPAFQVNPAQGRGGGGGDLDEAEYRKYYPHKGGA